MFCRVDAEGEALKAGGWEKDGPRGSVLTYLGTEELGPFSSSLWSFRSVEMTVPKCAGKLFSQREMRRTRCA